MQSAGRSLSALQQRRCSWGNNRLPHIDTVSDLVHSDAVPIISHKACVRDIVSAHDHDIVSSHTLAILQPVLDLCATHIAPVFSDPVHTSTSNLTHGSTTHICLDCHCAFHLLSHFLPVHMPFPKVSAAQDPFTDW